jgi:soluble lytic murein transglycosylase
MRRRFKLVFLCCLLFLPIYLFAANTNNISTDRRAFLLALTDLQHRNQQQFLILADHLRNYPLYPYLLYTDLVIHLPEATSEQLQGFLEAYKDTPLSQHLRELWLNQLAARSDWKTFVQVYQPSKDLSLQCDEREALWQTGKTADAVNNISEL